MSHKPLNKTEGIFDSSISKGYERNIEGIFCLVSVKFFEEGDLLILGWLEYDWDDWVYVPLGDEISWTKNRDFVINLGDNRWEMSRMREV